MTDITIRAFEMADWRHVADLFLAPRCQWHTLQMPYQSRDDIRRKLDMPPENMQRFVAVLGDRTTEQRVIGMLGLHLNDRRRRHSGGIGMFVHDEFHGQGVGSKLLAAALDYADNWLNLSRIELTVYIDNEAAIHLYRKFGFVIEGTMKHYALRNGSYVDAHLMARVGSATT